MIDETLVAVTQERAAELARVTKRQVEYWARTGLVLPSVTQKVTPHREVRLYGFADLMSLMVAAELRNRKISLQHIRTIVGRLRQRGYTAPLTQVAFAVIGRTVYMKHADGTWESGVKPDQVVLHQVLDLQPLRARISRAGERDGDTIGKIDQRRGVLGSKPVIKGTRVPVETIRRYLNSGRSVEDVLRAFPVLDRADVEAVQSQAVA